MSSKINGQPVVPSVSPSASTPSTPTGGGLRARVNKPINDVVPDLVGAYGMAWLHHTAMVRAVSPQDQRDAMVAYWIVEATFAHPIFHSYAIITTHLRNVPGKKPAQKYLEDATHEISVHVIHPQADREKMLRGPINPAAWIEPCNFASQFKVADDEEAFQWTARTVHLIVAGEMSPDPAFQKDWVQIYGNCMLRKEP